MEETAKRYNLTENLFPENVDEERLRQAFEESDVLVPSIAKRGLWIVQIGKHMVFRYKYQPAQRRAICRAKSTYSTVPPNDVKALADAMRWMVDHEEERIEMGRRARNRVKEYYRMDDMLDKVLNIYTNL